VTKTITRKSLYRAILHALQWIDHCDQITDSLIQDRDSFPCKGRYISSLQSPDRLLCPLRLLGNGNLSLSHPTNRPRAWCIPQVRLSAVKGPIHPKFNSALQLLKKNCTEYWTGCSLAQHRFPIRFVSFLISSVCLLVRVTMVDSNKAIVCYLLATSAIILSEKNRRKRKIWSKKWYFKRNISCDVHLLNELSECLDMMPSWCGQVNWGNCGIPWVNCAVLCVKDCKGMLRPALLPVKTAQFTRFFPRQYDVTH
jgi:hypothetical protein